MANAIEVQAFIDNHHKQCVQALQQIVALADTGSDEHKKRFAAYYSMGEPPSGWRIAEAMQIVAHQAGQEQSEIEVLKSVVDRMERALHAIATNRNDFSGPSLDYMQGYRAGQEYQAGVARNALGCGEGDNERI